MATISVIVPVYKAEEYLRCCVDSILAQTFTDIEVLLVDDGSPDGSGAICDEYAQKDIRVKVLHKANGGVSSARNAGLAHATGEYIMFTDSDDCIVPQACERLLQHAADGCWPIGSCYAWEDGEVSRYFPALGCDTRFAVQEFEKLGVRVYATWGRLYRREIIERQGLCFDEKLSYAEDAIFNHEYLRHVESIFVIEEPLYYYRILPSSLAHGRYIKDHETCINRLYESRMALAKKLAVDDADFCRRHYGEYFCELRLAFENMFRKDAPGSWVEKIRRGNTLLRSEEFAQVYPYRKEGPKTFTKKYLAMLALSYRTGNCLCLWLLESLRKMKNAVTGKIRS